MGRLGSSSVTNLLSNIVDNVKDFIDDEIIDRAWDTERDLRKAGRNWFDADDDEPAAATKRPRDRPSRQPGAPAGAASISPAVATN